MKIATKKHLYAMTINKKAYGEIEIVVLSEKKELALYGKIIGNYDEISDFKGETIKDAMEVLFDEQ